MAGEGGRTGIIIISLVSGEIKFQAFNDSQE